NLKEKLMSSRLCSSLALSAVLLFCLPCQLFGHDSHGQADINRPAFGPGTASITKAIEFFERKANASENDVLSRIVLGQLYLKAAKTDHDHSAVRLAFDRLRQAQSLAPENAEVEITLAQACMAVHQFERAIQYATRVLQRDPGDIGALAVLGDARFESGRYEKAFETYQQLSDASSAPGVQARLAQVDELRGNLSQARKRLTNAIESLEARDQTAHSAAWYLARRGDMALMRGDTDEAQRDYELALSRDRYCPDAMLGMARVMASRGDLTAGIHWCRQSLEESQSTDAKLYLIQLYQSEGQLRSAAKMVDDVLRDLHDHTHPHGHESNHGHQHVKHRHDHDGEPTTLHHRQIAELMLDRHIDDARALRLAQFEWQRRHDVKTAEILAWAYFKNGRPNEAKYILDKATRWGTRQPSFLFRAAVIHDAMGESQQAKAFLERLIAGNPRVLIGHVKEMKSLCGKYDLQLD
ncbi:MAG: tetratricopeptide repeat protein, partial [Planctomycetota bacterium]